MLEQARAGTHLFADEGNVALVQFDMLDQVRERSTATKLECQPDVVVPQIASKVANNVDVVAQFEYSNLSRRTHQRERERERERE